MDMTTVYNELLQDELAECGLEMRVEKGKKQGEEWKGLYFPPGDPEAKKVAEIGIDAMGYVVCYRHYFKQEHSISLRKEFPLYHESCFDQVRNWLSTLVDNLNNPEPSPALEASPTVEPAP